MAVTLKCPECGHTVQSEDDDPQTCPMCDGTMTKPKYKAKSGPTSSDRESAKLKAKAKSRPADDDDEEEEKPRPKKAAARPKQEALSLDDEEEGEGGGGDSSRNGKAAERIGINSGFKNRALMKQVESELSRGEVLHWAGRPSMAIARKHAMMARILGLVLILVGVGGVVAFLVIEKMAVPKAVAIVPAIFALFGFLFLLLGPKSIIRQAERGWYAVTDRRALVHLASLWGNSGHTTTYEPAELRKMWVKKSFWVTGAGSLVFKTEVREERIRHVDRRTGRTLRTETRRHVTHYGFLNIEDVKDVETLVHDVLLHADRDEDEEDDDE